MMLALILFLLFFVNFSALPIYKITKPNCVDRWKRAPMRKEHTRAPYVDPLTTSTSFQTNALSTTTAIVKSTTNPNLFGSLGKLTDLFGGTNRNGRQNGNSESNPDPGSHNVGPKANCVCPPDSPIPQSDRPAGPPPGISPPPGDVDLITTETSLTDSPAAGDIKEEISPTGSNFPPMPQVFTTLQPLTQGPFDPPFLAQTTATILPVIDEASNPSVWLPLSTTIQPATAGPPNPFFSASLATTAQPVAAGPPNPSFSAPLTTTVQAATAGQPSPSFWPQFFTTTEPSNMRASTTSRYLVTQKSSTGQSWAVRNRFAPSGLH